MSQLAHEKVGIGGSHLGAHGCVTYLIVKVVLERKVIPGIDKLGEGNQNVCGL